MPISLAAAGFATASYFAGGGSQACRAGPKAIAARHGRACRATSHGLRSRRRRHEICRFLPRVRVSRRRRRRRDADVRMHADALRTNEFRGFIGLIFEYFCQRSAMPDVDDGARCSQLRISLARAMAHDADKSRRLAFIIIDRQRFRRRRPSHTPKATHGRSPDDR